MTNPETIQSVSRTGSTRTAGPIMGHDVGGARPTAAGVFWLLVYLGLPVLLLGNLLDLMVQLSLGWCVGLWCIVS